MKNIRFPILFTTTVLFSYTILSVLFPIPAIIIIVFMLSPFLVIWMVYRVLKDGVPDNKTFTEYFYCDADIKRLPVKEQLEDGVLPE